MSVCREFPKICSGRPARKPSNHIATSNRRIGVALVPVYPSPDCQPSLTAAQPTLSSEGRGRELTASANWRIRRGTGAGKGLLTQATGQIVECRPKRRATSAVPPSAAIGAKTSFPTSMAEVPMQYMCAI
jgi:hypothetical protein